MTRFQVLAVNDEKDTCQCCGRSGLKRVVWISDTETGDIKHFGTTCATAPVKGFDVKAIKEAIKRRDSFEKTLNSMAHLQYRRAGGKYSRVDEFTARAADMLMMAFIKCGIVQRGFNH